MGGTAFIGLGVMGAPMARNLLRAGFDLSVFNRSRPAVDELVAGGARGAGSVAEVSAGADVVITMLPDSPDVEAVVLGPDGVLASLAPGSLLIDMSTVAPETAVRMAAAGTSRGVDVLDAPVSGGEAGAIGAALSIMVGGSDDAYTRALPWLRAMGTTIVRIGSAGAGQAAKAANQLIVAGTIELVAEAFVLLDALGVDVGVAREALAGGLAGSTVLDRKADAMLRRDFAPGFRVDLHHKDLSIVLEAARAASVALPLGVQVAGLVGSLRAQGAGALDHSALLLQVEQLSGRAAIDGLAGSMRDPA